MLVGVAQAREVCLSALSRDELFDFVRGCELAQRQVHAVKLQAVAEIEQRGIAREVNCASTAVLLSQLNRVDPAEAKADVEAARRLAPRVGLSGERFEPQFPLVAAAVTYGELSLRHARVITSMIERLPDAVLDEPRVADCERFLVEQARIFEPRTLAHIARRLSDTLDPDGTLADAAHRERHRELSVHQRADGSARVDGELTPLCAEALLTCLDATAKPNPAQDGTPDPRSPAQRRHDGLHDTLMTALRSGQVPNSGGVAATIQVTMTKEQAETASGLALTGHGALIPVPVALSLAGDAQVQTVVTTKVGAIEAYSSTHRIFTAAQRLAMAVRDGGCSMPGCTIPAAWTQAHHIIEYSDGGPTTIINGTLLCGDHHRHHEQRGWTCVMIDAIPHWIPPPWLDPSQTPRRNHAHDPPVADDG